MISNSNYSCRYEEPQVGISKAEQENNTAFQNLPFDPELSYADEMAQLTQLTSQLNDTINQKLCFESDDEDCVRKVLYVCNSSSLPDYPSLKMAVGLETVPILRTQVQMQMLPL